MPSQEERHAPGLGDGNPGFQGLVTLLGAGGGTRDGHTHHPSQHPTLPNEAPLMNPAPAARREPRPRPVESRAVAFGAKQIKKEEKRDQRRSHESQALPFLLAGS